MKALLSLATPKWSTSESACKLETRHLLLWVVGDPEAIGASFRGISTYKSAFRQEIEH